MKNILQIGFGPLGIQISKFIAKKSTVQTVAVVDLDTNLIGKSIFQINEELSNEVKIYRTTKEALDAIDVKPDVIIITTVSSLGKFINQVEEIAKYGIPIISTCEELSYPWILQPELSKHLDQVCKANNIPCLGTGINPGFLMDYLPSVLTSISKEIEHITVERVQDATPRRVPFQKKIGAGLAIDAFRKKEAEGTLRHVGLLESVYLLADASGIKLDNVTESLNPVIAENDVASNAIKVKKGEARGVEQIGIGYVNGVEKIRMHFKAAIGEEKSFDKVSIKGVPNFSSEIEGGINGDIGTCAITINCVNSILKASAGLQTMSSIGVPGYVN